VDSKGGGRRESLEYLYENKVDLRGLYGEGGFFGNIDLHGANLAWADLNDSNFEEANLQNVDLQDAHFERARLSRAKLTTANLARAHLTCADLKGADLKGANLSPVGHVVSMLGWVFQCRTHAEDAALTCADLKGADLSRASGLIQQQIDAAAAPSSYNPYTKLPPGIIAPKSWPTKPSVPPIDVRSPYRPMKEH
jgi:uncharacterized protein YjbI with pentapeptide repeats